MRSDHHRTERGDTKLSYTTLSKLSIRSVNSSLLSLDTIMQRRMSSHGSITPVMSDSPADGSIPSKAWCPVAGNQVNRQFSVAELENRGRADTKHRQKAATKRFKNFVSEQLLDNDVKPSVLAG